jgi:hypothetical protein
MGTNEWRSVARLACLRLVFEISSESSFSIQCDDMMDGEQIHFEWYFTWFQFGSQNIATKRANMVVKETKYVWISNIGM